MFCRNCGKNIYDLEKCPFCNDGENVQKEEAVEQKIEPPTEQKPMEAKETAEPKEAQAESKAENEEKKEVKKEKKEDNYKIPTSANEPDEKDEGFAAVVAKENKAFKVFDNLGFIPIVAIVASAFLLFLYVWITDKTDAKFFVILFQALNLLLPCFWFFVLEIVFQVVQLIIFMVEVKKKNPTVKSLFAGVYLGDGNYEYGDMGHCDTVWQALSLKYDKTSFIISIFTYIVKIAEIGILTSLARPILINVVIPAANAYDAFTQGFRQLVFGGENGNKIIVFVAVMISLEIVKFILNRIRKISHKKLVKKLKIGEIK